MIKLKRTAAAVTALMMASAGFSVYADTIDPLKVKSSDGFRYVVENNEVMLTGFASTMDPVQVIPETIDGMPVTAINALWGNVTELVIPPSVKKINSSAFKGNTKLVKAVIPESVTEMGSSVFEGCTKLESCELEADISEIPYGTFFGCSSLSELKYSDSIESFGGGAFSGCAELEEIDIPDGMTEIPGALFNGCTSLKKAEIPDGVISIGKSAFRNCQELTQINIPDGVEYIGEYAFAGCSSVTAFRIPDGVGIINNGLFSGCTSLKTAVLPETAQSFSENSTEVFCRELFKNCSSLKEIEVPYGVRDIGESCFDGCTSLEKLIIPETVINIDNYAFRNCASLKEILLPDYSVIYGHETFAGCTSLEELYVPETVYSFAGGGSGVKTFRDCKNLKTLYLPSAGDATYPDCFDGCDSLEDLYIGFEHGSFAVNHLGYIYDENTDTRTKNENLKIYCRENSAALKYAQENGFDYEIIGGVNAELVYFGTYDDPDDVQEVYITELNIDERTFINGEGEFRNSQRIGLMDNGQIFRGLQNSLLLIMELGFDEETYPHIEAEPAYLNFDGTDLLYVYDSVTYSTEVLDDGNWYLIIECSADEGNDVTSRKITGGKMNVGFTVTRIGDSGSEAETAPGDADGNGVVNTADIVKMAEYILNISPDDIFPGNSDLNSDGKIDIADLILLKSLIML